MLLFIDESWQLSDDKRHKAGVLAAIPILSKDFNDISLEARNIKRRHLGLQAENIELKGQRLFQRYYFRLEKKGLVSTQLTLARDLFSMCERRAVKSFATVTFPKDEHDLACANPDQLERPFYFLFERINQYVKEAQPDSVAKLVFDDRGVSTNERISKTVSNFFHKSKKGLTFDRILKVPLFAISGENIGIQIADLFGHIIGRRFTGDKALTVDFFQRVKTMQFESREPIPGPVAGQEIRLRGIKVIRERTETSPAEEAL